MKNIVASFLGGFFAVGVFLITATYFFGDPFGDWFMSAHGIFTAQREIEITEQENLHIYQLMTRGLVISADGIIENITSLYGNMIQALIGVLALATVLAFVAVRWQSIQAAEEYIETKSSTYFSSREFQTLVSGRVADYVDTLDPATNPQMGTVDPGMEISELRNRILVLEQFIQRSSSAEEPEEDNQLTDTDGE